MCCADMSGIHSSMQAQALTEILRYSTLNMVQWTLTNPNNLVPTATKMCSEFVRITENVSQNVL